MEPVESFLSVLGVAIKKCFVQQSNIRNFLTDKYTLSELISFKQTTANIV